MTRYVAAETAVSRDLGDPIGRGRNRVVFRDKGEVVKVPMTPAGESANQCELSIQGELYARTRKDEGLSDSLGVLVIRMEFVTHVGWSREPDWTWSIDGGQVGQTRDGRLVAYDWDRE